MRCDNFLKSKDIVLGDKAIFHLNINFIITSIKLHTYAVSEIFIIFCDGKNVLTDYKNINK